MITILPVQGESLARVRQTCPAVTDLLVMKDGEQELGSVGVSVGNSSLEICSLEVACNGETERRFYADSLLRAAASLAACGSGSTAARPTQTPPRRCWRVSNAPIRSSNWPTARW